MATADLLRAENKVPLCGVYLMTTDGRILLMKRAVERKLFPDMWEVPGGHVDPQETPATAIIRETEEETGLRIDGEGLRELGRFTYKHNGTMFDITAFLYQLSGTNTDTIRISSEHTRFSFFPLYEVAAKRSAGEITPLGCKALDLYGPALKHATTSKSVA